MKLLANGKFPYLVQVPLYLVSKIYLNKFLFEYTILISVHSFRLYIQKAQYQMNFSDFPKVICEKKNR